MEHDMSQLIHTTHVTQNGPVAMAEERLDLAIVLSGHLKGSVAVASFVSTHRRDLEDLTVIYIYNQQMACSTVVDFTSV